MGGQGRRCCFAVTAGNGDYFRALYLLTHTGGTGDFFGPEFDERRLSLKTHDDYVRLFGERAPTHPPGTEPRR